MRSPSRAWRWLVRKEWRELMASRAWWVMLALIGPLVGLSFIEAVRSYAEVSAGTGTGCGVVCSPLIGVWAPTFGAYEIASVFLLPFVAIRLVAGDRQSGALKLELQQSVSPVARVAAKAIVLLAGWLVTGLAGAGAIVLWKLYGGSAYAPEIAVVAFGHVLNAGLTIALAVTAASVTEHPATAAIATLAVTVGTWVLEFAAAVHGGVWDTLAAFTPAAMVGAFQRGLVQANVVLIALAFILTGFAIAAVWMRLGIAVGRRALDTVGVLAAATALVVLCTFVRGSWDASESRQNSFSEPDEAALEQIRAPLTIEVHLAPQDPRRMDLEREALSKLRRVLPGVTVRYVARTSTGLFEEADPGYGEIWYSSGGRRVMSRTTTGEGVLETIFGLTGVAPAAENEVEFPGYPLVARPVGAALLFYGFWPALAIGAGVLMARRNT